MVWCTVLWCGDCGLAWQHAGVDQGKAKPWANVSRGAPRIYEPDHKITADLKFVVSCKNVVELTRQFYVQVTITVLNTIYRL